MIRVTIEVGDRDSQYIEVIECNPFMTDSGSSPSQQAESVKFLADRAAEKAIAAINARVVS